MSTTPALREQYLWFSLGYLRLFPVSSLMLVRGYSLRDLLDGPEQEPESAGDLPDDCQGIVTRSEPVAERLDSIHFADDHIRYIRSQYERHYIDLRGTFDEYMMSNFSSKTRSTLRRKERRFGDQGKVEARLYRSPDELRDFYPLARLVSEKTYQERLLSAGLPSSRDFQQAMLEAGAAGSVRAFILFSNEEPVAYLYCPLDRGVVVYKYLGYDASYSHLSPGTVLQLSALRALFAEEPCRFFDFTQGDSVQKRRFGTHSVHCGDVYRFRRNIRNATLVHAHRASVVTNSALLWSLDRLGLKSRAKALLRGSGR